MVPEAGKSKIRVPAGSSSREGPLPGCRLPASCRVLTSTREKQALWSLFCQGTNLSHGASTLVTQSPPKGPSSNITTVGVRISIQKFWGTQTFKPSYLASSFLALKYFIPFGHRYTSVHTQQGASLPIPSLSKRLDALQWGGDEKNYD